MTYKDKENIETFLLLNGPQKYIEDCLKEVHIEYGKNDIKEDVLCHIFPSLKFLLRKNLESKTVNLEVIELIVSSITLYFSFIDEEDISKRKSYIHWEFDLNKIWNFNRTEFNMIVGFSSKSKRPKKEQLFYLTQKINEIIEKQNKVMNLILYDIQGIKINYDSFKFMSCNI